MMSSRAISLILISAWPACAAANLETDWPQFLGPHANGTSSERGLLDKWPATGPPIVWHKEIGAGYGAPSIKSNSLVLHHRIRDEEIVECLDSATGKALWRYGCPSHF